MELGDNNKLKVKHHALVNISQVYEVNALYKPTFHLSLLSINEFDTAGYTATFGHQKWSISSSSITITGNWVNDLYIIFPTTVLISMSTKSTSKRKKERASSSTHITVPSFAHSNKSTTTSSLHTALPSAASTVPPCPPTSIFIKITRKPFIISESPLWRHRQTHINPTTLRSLIDGYTKDDAMCTAFIQAKHKQKIIKLKTKRTTMLFEHIHSDVYEPFSRPTTAGHHYYLLIITNYPCYTSVWVLPDTNSKTCTSAYQSFQARVDARRYEGEKCRCDNGCIEYCNETFQLALTAWGTTYQPCLPYAHHWNGVVEHMIQTITKNARFGLTISLAPLAFWREAVNAAVYLYKPISNEGLTKGDDCDSYQVPYAAP